MAPRLTLAPSAPPALTAGPLVRHAYAFAEHAHRGQRRKDGQAFIAHPVQVARLLAGLGYGEEVLAAALLHDVVEDTPVTLPEIRQAFGLRVALLVDFVTEDETLRGDARKRAYRERVRLAPSDAQAICAADKVCNLGDLRAAAASGDHVTMQRFHGGLHVQAARFAAEHTMLRDAGADPALVAALERGIAALRAEAARHALASTPSLALAA
jgi:guanosine-3',5'-bis(diphosphate) 3'-pyrophosphohydrolase